MPYLASLGVTHLHLSPVLEAVPGSTHGYDVTDHSRVREELGGEAGLRALAATARAHGLGLVVDLVPNHMAAALPHNRPLWEVLRDGPASPYARWFDIDWDAGGGKVLLPVLPTRIGDLLGDLRVDAGEGLLRHGTQVFPLREGTAGLPLPELLDAQWYRPVWWRLARTELNYRRFFTISDLIGVRVEDPEVFAATHAKVLELVRDGVVEGLRIDHPDGLADPDGYLEALREAAGGSCWIVLEKILTGDERLPADWPVAGTTGYDALRRIDGLFVDPAGAEELAELYRHVAAPAGDRGGHWDATARRAAYKVVTHELAAEVACLTRTAGRVCAASPALRDHAPWALRAAVRELLIRVPVYRPYRTGGEQVLTEEAALAAKGTFAVADEAAAVDVVRDLALGLLGDGPDQRAFRARFAQTASALRAKSVEDTAFYRYVPLLSANEVGGDPGRPAVAPREFHAYCERIARDWPLTGTVLSTHDTSAARGRAGQDRGAVGVPRPVGEAAGRRGAGAGARRAARLVRVADGPGAGWARRRPVGRCAAEGGAGGGAAHELDGAGPRVRAGGGGVPGGGPGGGAAAHRGGAGAGARPARAGERAGRGAAAPGDAGRAGPVPGHGGGVRGAGGPDNRAPFRQVPPDEKTALTRAALTLRRRRPEVFGAAGTYVPLAADGPAAEHCVAFCRSGGVVVAVTRLSLRLAEAGGWAGTALALPPGRWRDALAEPDGGVHAGGRPVPLAELFATRPVALLEDTE